jgi:SMC interacting uncharacterized protein involved in chromosome segregation
MCWAVSLSLLPSTFRGDNMTKDDRGDQDLTKQLEIKEKETHALNDVVVNLKNIIDSKEAEMTALINANDSHRELNGQLRKELDQVKADNKKLAKQVEDLEIEAKEMLAYP